MVYDNVFIHAHACRLDEKFKLSDKMTKGNLGKIRLYFKTDIDTCLEADSTQIDLNSENYKIKESQKAPNHIVYDYSLEFKDPVQDFGLNTFGIFTEDAKRLFPEIEINKLSDIIEKCNKDYKTTRFYLHICRKLCDTTPKKTTRKKTKSKKTKGGKKKTKTKRSRS
jgi:hypothetical protein